MTRTNERAMNIADALRVAIQHQTNSTGRTALRYDRLDNLLYADKAYDITKDVVAGLNKAYKKKPAAIPAKTEKSEK